MARETTSKTAKQSVRTRARGGGRPRKFREPSRSVTVTLPQRTLNSLRWIDADRAKAIVKAVDDAVSPWKDAGPQVDVLEMAPGTGLVVVPAHRSLKTVAWIRMIQIAPARYLLAVEPGTPSEKVEVALMDLIDEASRSAPDEVPVLAMLRATLGKLRRDNKLSRAEVLLIDIGHR
jgi:hypothetical protein